MNKKTQLLLKQAEEVLANPEMLEKFAQLNTMTVDLARQTLERLMREPEVSEKIEAFVFASTLLPSSSWEKQRFPQRQERRWIRGTVPK